MVHDNQQLNLRLHEEQISSSDEDEEEEQGYNFEEPSMNNEDLPVVNELHFEVVS